MPVSKKVGFGPAGKSRSAKPPKPAKIYEPNAKEYSHLKPMETYYGDPAILNFTSSESTVPDTPENFDSIHGGDWLSGMSSSHSGGDTDLAKELIKVKARLSEGVDPKLLAEALSNPAPGFVKPSMPGVISAQAGGAHASGKGKMSSGGSKDNGTGQGAGGQNGADGGSGNGGKGKGRAILVAGGSNPNGDDKGKKADTRATTSNQADTGVMLRHTASNVTVKMQGRLASDQQTTVSPAEPHNPNSNKRTAEQLEGPAKQPAKKPRASAKSKAKIAGDEQEGATENVPAGPEGMLSSYDPVGAATWLAGEHVPFAFLAASLEKLQNTSKRLEITAIVTNLLRSVVALSPGDLLPCVYFLLSRVAPAHAGIELGVGDSVLIQAIAEATGREIAAIKLDLKKEGDLGAVAQQSRRNQQTMLAPKPLTVVDVFNSMKSVSAAQGKDSVKARREVIKGLLIAARGPEPLFIVRALQGKLRVGLAEPSVIVALASAVVLTPPLSLGRPPPPQSEWKKLCAAAAEGLKAALSQQPCYETVIPFLLAHPPSALETLCSLKPGVPVKPMLAHPTKGVTEIMDRMGNQTFTCEYKYDGERGQVHIMEGGQIKVFSRNSEDNTEKYPDIVRTIPEILSTRARKKVEECDVKVKIRLFVFDLLFLNGRSLLQETLDQRRKLLFSALKESDNLRFVTHRECSEAGEVLDFLQTAVEDSCEGLMIKAMDSLYEPDKRSRLWLKVKKDYIEGMTDSVDLVLLGAWHGKGKRTSTFGAFLLACYCRDSGEYQTVCKLGTGFSDEALLDLTNTLTPLILPGPQANYRVSDSNQPDVWFAPKFVWEVAGADLTLSPQHTAALPLLARTPPRGIALRFPRYIRERDDKGPTDATTGTQILEMYQSQDMSLRPASARQNEKPLIAAEMAPKSTGGNARAPRAASKATKKL